jgi:hypothetical protein
MGSPLKGVRGTQRGFTPLRTRPRPYRCEAASLAAVLSSSQALQAEAERTNPHLIVANEVPPELKEEGSSFWVELRASDVLVATISADGYSDTVRDVSLQDLIAVVDKAEEELAQNETS